MNESFPATGENGVPDHVEVLTKAVNSKMKAEKKEIALKAKKIAE